ncbi:hypothetical protein EDD41_2169 [Luteococcus japonicus]|uniref:Glucosidase n=1 Tax=Luteococcus japonicus TaxID=33984 RepID=A0A3N1ZVR0_9ACTN|nr:hypothetical protein [Luteococcus japonicus]ROR54934.1 hypothetical protein EDD41_2169 [Luteococcus japonicus]
MLEAVAKTAEGKRLAQSASQDSAWRRWGPYVSSRQWGTVREDYSADGAAWADFPFDQAHTRAYRWGEDGLAGICDRYGFLNLAVALWNGHDDRLKERLFGLTGPEGNHGEDVKEYYWHLDATPTHLWAQFLYRYPQAAFPYQQLREANRERGYEVDEYELTDSGVLDGNGGAHDLPSCQRVRGQGPAVRGGQHTRGESPTGVRAAGVSGSVDPPRGAKVWLRVVGSAFGEAAGHLRNSHVHPLWMEFRDRSTSACRGRNRWPRDDGGHPGAHRGGRYHFVEHRPGSTGGCPARPPREGHRPVGRGPGARDPQALQAAARLAGRCAPGRGEAPAGRQHGHPAGGCRLG